MKDFIREQSVQAADNVSLYSRHNRDNWFKVNRYYAMNFDFFEMEPHTHGEFEIMYIASGCCNIYSWTQKEEKRWEMKEGEYVIIDGDTKHQLEVVRGVRCRILNLEISLLPQVEDLNIRQLSGQSKSLEDFLKMPIPIFKGYDTEGNLHSILTDIHKQLQNSTDEMEHKVMQNLNLARLMIELGRQRTKKYRNDGGSKYVRMALAYMNNNYDKDIRIEDIAEETGISSAYLQRLFKEKTGKTLVDKVNELRIEKAKLLLETSRLPVTDIAFSVGFNNRQHFAYTFRKLTGCSPSVYCKHRGDYQIWI